MSDEFLEYGLIAKSSDREQCSAPGICTLFSLGPSARRRGSRAGSGFRCRGDAERIYRANINLGLAEVPRDYFDTAQAPDF